MSNKFYSEANLETILKLLALADPGSGASRHEAEAAWSTAQRLITKYRIEQAVIDTALADRVKGQTIEFKIGDSFIKTGRVMRVDFERNIAQILMRCFGVKVLWGTWRNPEKDNRKEFAYWLVGDDMDRVIAQAVYGVLYKAMFSGVRSLLKDMSEARGYKVKWTAPIGRNFYDGVEHGYCAMSEQGRKLAIATAKKEDADAFALVLVDKDKAINLYQEERFGTCKIIKDNRKADFNKEAFTRGTLYGQKLDLDNSNKLGGPEEGEAPTPRIV